MRRVLGQCARAAANWIRTFALGWKAFWFTPADPALLGLLRILAGSMLFYTHAVWGLALADFFGPDGWLQADAVHALQWGAKGVGGVDAWAMSYWWWIPPGAMWWAHGAALFVLLLFTLGIFTRVTSVLAYVITISYVHRVPSALFGLDQINGLLALYIAIGYLTIPARDRSLALDRWIFRKRARRGTPLGVQPLMDDVRPNAGANLAVRLIQVHMCIIYLFAGMSKLQGPAWWSGEAMWLAFANLEYQSADMTWLANHPLLVNVMTHFTIAWELSFCVLIWLPRWRPLVLAGAVALHVGIGAFLGMWTFGLVMLIGCAAFLPQSFARWLANRFSRRCSAETSGCVVSETAAASTSPNLDGQTPAAPRERTSANSVSASRAQR